MKKLFLLLAVFLIMGNVITSCTSEDIISNELSECMDANVNQRAQAREIGEKLLNSFGMTKTRSLNEDEYPDYYGGEYINKDGKLIVFVKEDFSKNKSILVNSIGDFYYA